MANTEHWTEKKWRPMMGWVYMVTCVTDFIIFPVLWSIWQAGHGQVITQWDPITLRGAGLFHMAMGAILGVTAWSRGQEKMAGVNNAGIQQTSISGVNSSVGVNSSPVIFQPGSTNSNTTVTAVSGVGGGSVSSPTASSKKIVPVGTEPEL